jgi:hypothetical protein
MKIDFFTVGLVALYGGALCLLIFLGLRLLRNFLGLQTPPASDQQASRRGAVEPNASTLVKEFLFNFVPIMVTFSLSLWASITSPLLGPDTAGAPPATNRSSPSSASVYNAIAMPNGGEPDILLHGIPTRISFYIGPPSTRNFINRPDISDALRDRLHREDAIDLTVTMTCHVCADILPQTKSIRYVSALGASTVAVFDILPDFVQAELRKATSIVFSIDGKGVEYDFLKVPVQIKPERGEMAVRQPLHADECVPSLNDPNEPRNDLIVRVARANDASLKVSFTAPDAELARRLAQHDVERNGSPKFFKTGARSPDVVTLTAGATYSRLKALVEQEQSIREQVPDVASVDARAQYIFVRSSEKEVIRTLYELGINMYDTLFYTGDPDLLAILNTIERYGDEKENLRVLIYTESIYLPWQLLHAKQSDGDAPDPTQFWGNKYILGVIPTDAERGCGRLPGEMKLPAKNAVLYAHYWQALPDQKNQQSDSGIGPITVNSGRDAVSRLGEMFGRVVSDTLGGSVSIVRNKLDFKSRLKASRRDLLIFWSFTHGHSGDTFLALPGRPIVGSELAGQRLDFSQSEFISAYELKTETIDEMSPLFFAARPFVFLNGCETGTQGARGTTDLSLPGIFLMRGARGVVATEAPIWDLFGYNFGVLFLSKLTAGLEAGEAMLATRREFLNESKNPLGLLYTYYGNPAVRLARPRT